MLILLIVLTVPVATALWQPVAATDGTVNPSMNTDEIQFKVNDASDGDTITFLAGIYDNFKLTISNALNLVGDGAVLNGNGISTINVSGSNTSWTNITGFTINGDGTNNGIYASNTSGLSIKNNMFNNTKYAVYLENVNETIIQSNEVYNNTKYSFYIFDFYKLSKNNVIIDNNTMINTNGGIHIEGSGLTITNNYMDGYGGYDNGIDGMYVYGALIENNTILNLDDAINIYRESHNLTIVKNTIINASRDGISIINREIMETETRTTIANNTVENAAYGIFIGGKFHGLIYGNLINNTSITGMNITGKGTFRDGSLNATITGNNIISADNIGIAMENPNVLYLLIDNNTIGSNGYSIEYGVYYRKNGTVVIGDGNIFTNTQNHIISQSMANDYIQSILDGAKAGDTITFLGGTYNNIMLTITKALNLVGNRAILNGNGTPTVFNVSGSNASGTNITGFTIKGASGNGISLNSVNDVKVTGNNIIKNSVGVGINNSQKNNLTNNNINENTGSGVEVSSGSKNNKISGNNISDNDGDGVYLKDSDNNTVSGNTISDNGRTGVGLNNSDDNTVRDNTIHHNEKGVSETNSVNNTILNNNVYDNGIPLKVTKIDPAKYVVDAGKVINITFTEKIKPGNLSIELKKSNGSLVQITKSINGNILTITPNGPLGEGKYTLYLQDGCVVDRAGNPLGYYTSNFTVDTVAPKVSKIDPKNGATNVAAGKTIKVTFSETIKESSSNFRVELKNSGGKYIPFVYTIKGNVLTIDPTSNLAESRYQLILRPGCLTDLAGNILPGFNSYFSVGASPKVSKIDPKNGAARVAASKTIKVTFNEAVKVGGKFWVELKNSRGKAVAFKYKISGKTLTIDPTKNLAESKYTLVLHTGAVTDLAGNALAGKSTTFTVGTAPKVSKIDPKNGATKVSRGKTIKVTFNEVIKAGKNYKIELKTVGGKKVSIKKSIRGKVLTIKHTKLAAKTKYKLVIYTGSVTDKAGNPVAAKTYTFTTGRN